MTNLEESLQLLQKTHEASLGTLEDGKPFVSATGFIYESSGQSKYGALYILASDLARHSRNIQKNPNVSLLILEPNPNAPIHERKRVTVQGKTERVEDKGRFPELKAIYLKYFPKSEIFFTLPDFRFYRIEILELHWIGGFGKAETFR